MQARPRLHPLQYRLILHGSGADNSPQTINTHTACTTVDESEIMWQGNLSEIIAR